MKKRRKMSNGERKLLLHSKLEEALEVKSLRRIISAYLNYSDAAEEDVVRYERSFKKLPPTHKALLSHFSLKLQRLRRCISINSVFIMDMLQAFEPPIDMSQAVDNCESEHLNNVHGDYCSEERSFRSGQLVSTSGRTLETNQVNGVEGSSLTCRSPEGRTMTEVPMIPESVTRRCSLVLDDREESDTADNSRDTNATIVNNSAEQCSVSDSNGNVCSASYDWLDQSLQLNVPPVDVDKYMPGGSLYDFLHKHHNVLELPILLKFAIDVCEGMEYLHRKNIIHRDLKTANLLMDTDKVVKVADFGVARFQSQGGVMTAETGTYRWMAPEVINHQTYDQKADVFSFAVVLWELTTAKVPYDTMTPLQAALGVRQGLRPSLPENAHPRLLDLMQRCWEAVPSNRPSFSEIIDELKEILQEIQVPSDS